CRQIPLPIRSSRCPPLFQSVRTSPRRLWPGLVESGFTPDGPRPARQQRGFSGRNAAAPTLTKQLALNASCCCPPENQIPGELLFLSTCSTIAQWLWSFVCQSAAVLSGSDGALSLLKPRRCRA